MVVVHRHENPFLPMLNKQAGRATSAGQTSRRTPARFVSKKFRDKLPRVPLLRWTLEGDDIPVLKMKWRTRSVWHSTFANMDTHLNLRISGLLHSVLIQFIKGDVARKQTSVVVAPYKAEVQHDSGVWATRAALGNRGKTDEGAIAATSGPHRHTSIIEARDGSRSFR